MNGKQVAGAVLNMAFRLAISCVVIAVVYKAAIFSYNFGYMVFTDTPKDASPGYDITVAIPENSTVKQIAQYLKADGVIEDEKIFYVQELLSEYHGKLKSGVYELNSSMTAGEIMEKIAGAGEEQEEQSSDSK